MTADSQSPDDPGSPPAIQHLDLEACHAILARHRLCILSVVDGGAPYAVPLFYGFDGATLHLGLAEGRKTRALDANPALCITVTELGEGDAWASVQVTGVAEWVEEPAARAESVRALMEHNRRIRALRRDAAGETAGAPAPPAPRRHGTGRILRVADPQITGRARR